MYADRYGNQMPDSDIVEISIGNKLQIYQKFLIYVQGLPQKNWETPLQASTFYTIWKKRLRNIKVPRSTSFTKCDTCCKFKDRLSQIGSTYANRAKWVAEFDCHLDQQMEERKQYYRNREHARTHPEEAWCLMVDGMAQHATNVPSFPVKPKSLFGKQTYDLHVIGVMFHGAAQNQVYVHDSSVPTGPSNTIQCIWNAIVEQSKVQKLPPVLYLQLDNTASDNKNHHVFEFAAWLVEEGYFQDVFFLFKTFSHLTHTLFSQVKIGFMMVGHTHDDVDQMFGCFSRGFKWKDHPLFTMDDMLEILRANFSCLIGRVSWILFP